MPSLRPWLVCIALPFLAAACSGADDAETADHHDDGMEEQEEEVGSTASALSATSPVSAAVTASCSTSSVKGLSTQLLQEISCLKPGSMKRIDGTPGLVLGSTVFPYLQTPAANALVAAQKARGVSLRINSGLRALPAQYLLYRWYKAGRCGIPLAAKPGTSNHESGIAVDIADNAAWRSAMTSKGYRWLGANDPVHFDYVGGGTVNMKGLSVRAFQRLWNRNNPADKIAEDGVYGPATEARLAKAPVGGFAKGATCTTTLSAPNQDVTLPLEGDLELDGEDTPAVPDATEGDGDPGDGADTTTDDALDGPAAEQGCSAAPLGANGLVSSTVVLGAAALAIGRRRRRARPAE